MSPPTLHLIAHLVRSRPAFDIAHRVCPGSPPCQPLCGLFDGESCVAQDEDWWIIPTSGHRAYPFWHKSLADLGIDQAPDGTWAYGWDHVTGTCEGLIGHPPTDPPPDHYSAPTPLDLPTLLNLIPPLRITRR